MKVVLGIERWTIQPESVEEYIIFMDYMNRLPKVSGRWDTFSDINVLNKQIQGMSENMWAGMSEFPLLVLDFDADENLEKT